MTGTNIQLTDEWIASYAKRVGVPEGTVVRGVTDFQKDVDSYTEALVKAGIDKIGALCIEDGFPRLDDYLPNPRKGSVIRLSDEEKEARKDKAEQEAIERRERAKETHRLLREKLNMPQVN